MRRPVAEQARRRSITDRVHRAAERSGQDVSRLRRSVVFHRLLARVAGDLVLKGGFCLEARLPGAARATKDVDLVGRLALAGDSDTIADLLQQVLDGTAADDGFRFVIDRVRELRGQGSTAPAWRAGISAYLEGRLFERLTVDLVGQVEELVGGTELLVIEPPVLVPGHEAVQIEAVDVFQHAAEKLHALARTYVGDRPSTRVKDLVDIVLLLDAGLLQDAARLGERLRRVFAVRDDATPLPVLPEPPLSWADDYVALICDLRCSARTVDSAHRLADHLYTAALTERNHP